VNRINAATLIELAATTLRDDLMPELPAEKRYAAAMVANALDIACREIKADTEAPMWALLDAVYEEGEGGPAKLAADIRSGTISEAKHPGLGKRLLAVLEAELAISNPRFLKRPA
jgi:cytochrome c551/c552